MGLVAAAYWQRSIAAAQLAAEQARTMELNGELASLSHISQALATRTELTDLRAQAMATKDFSGVDALKARLTAAGVEVRMSKAGVELLPGPGFDPAKLEAL